MSVATELVPDFDIPERALRHVPGERLATVTTLHRPRATSIAPPLRLTHRGVVVLGAFVALLAAALVVVAWLSAPRAASAPQQAKAPAVVEVREGDSLWSIAARVAPQRDPRAEVLDLQQLNHLGTADLTPGQVLRTR